MSCLIPLLWSIQSQGETEEEKLDGTKPFPFYSHFYLFFLFLFPPLETSSVGLKQLSCILENFILDQGKLAVLIICQCKFSLALLHVVFGSDSKLVYMSSINLLNSGFLSMAFGGGVYISNWV